MGKHYAYLVETRRVDGAPRQRVVAYLGTIGGQYLRTDYYGYPHTAAWARFWHGVDAKLDALGVSGEERARHEAKLADVVPRPDPDILKTLQAQAAVFLKMAAHG